MRKAILLLFVIAILSACSRRPVQQDLPHSEGNSVDHSGRRNLTIESSPNAASAPHELQFLDTMIAQHETVIDMAQLAQTRAGSDMVKSLAHDVITRHRGEITDMRGLREKYFGGADAAINVDLPGVSDSFAAIDLEKLDDLKGRPFDVEFMRELADTFKGSIVLAQYATAHASDETERAGFIRQLAQQIIDNRSRDLVDLHE